jgi:hypothetical protein
MVSPSPPSFLNGAFVVAYARIDESVRFVQRHTLSVDGQWLGRVPCLAICEDFESTEILVQYCDESWEPLGVSAGYKSVDEAQKRTELSYSGVSSKWVPASTSKEAAHAHYLAELKSHSCSFCGRTPPQVSTMFGDEVRICNYCVVDFHDGLSDAPAQT